MINTIESTGKAFLTLDEASGIARCSTVTLRRAVRARRLAVCRPHGERGKILIRAQDLTRYLEGGRIKAVGETR